MAEVFLFYRLELGRNLLSRELEPSCSPKSFAAFGEQSKSPKNFGTLPVGFSTRDKITRL